jgi:cytochrome c oxidase subunit IV
MNSQSHAAHITGPRTYAAILATLFFLTALTVTAAGFDFGSLNVVIALLIASVKAGLVALFFMHLRHDKPMNAIIFVSGLVFLSIFLVLCFVDTGSRDDVRPAFTRPAAVLPKSAPAK